MKNHDKPLFEKILLIDDDEASTFLSIAILDEMHAANKIEVAQDGLIASGLIGSGNWPDIIFLDINMPRMDGFEFLEFLKRTGAPETAKIVMLTNSYRKEDRDKAFSYENVLEYIEKPLTQDIVCKINAAYQR